MPRRKIYEIEIMRSLAFAAVVLQHVLGAYSGRIGVTFEDNVIIGVLFGLSKFAVPMFIFLSGMVLFYNYYGNLRYPDFIKKRFVKIFMPYFVWSLIYYVWNDRPFDFELFRLKDFIIKTSTGSASYHLWYVFMLFQIFILLPLIFFLFKYIGEICKTASAFIAAFLTFSGLYILLLVFYLSWQGIPFIDTVFVRNAGKNSLFYVYYFVCGGIAALHYDRFVLFVKKYVFVSAAGFLIFFAYTGYILFAKGCTNNRLNFNYMGSMNIRFYFFTCFSILLLYVVALAVSKKLPRLTNLSQFTGMHSFEAYLAHALVITFVNMLMLKYLSGLNLKVYYLILYTVSLTGAILTAYLTDRVKAAVKSIFKNKSSGSAQKVLGS